MQCGTSLAEMEWLETVGTRGVIRSIHFLYFRRILLLPRFYERAGASFDIILRFYASLASIHSSAVPYLFHSKLTSSRSRHYRSAVQIKSHGQKLLSKAEAGEDIFADLNEYERVTGTNLRPSTQPGFLGTDGTYFSELMGDAAGLVQVRSMDDGENIPPPSRRRALGRPSTAAGSRPIISPSEKMTIGHFGATNPISFLNDSPVFIPDQIDYASAKMPGSSVKSPAQNQRDMHAAMVLCQLGTIDSATQTAVASRLSFSPWANAAAAAARPSFSSGTRSAFDCIQQSLDAFEPISIQNMDNVENQELLAACCPVILQEQTFNPVVTPTEFAEV